MKHKSNYLKSSISALALSLVLLENITPPDSTPGDPDSFPRQPVIEDENPAPENGEDEGLQPLSDLDEKVKKLET